jgi:hypothetical protein
VSGCRIVLILIFFYSQWRAFQKNLLARLLLVICAFAGPALLAWAALIVIMGIAPGLWPAQLVWFLVPAVCVAVTSLLAFASVGMQLFRGTSGTASPLSKSFTDLACILYALSAVWFFKVFPFYAPHAVAIGAALSPVFFWSAVALLLALAIILLGRLFHRPISAFIGLSAVAGILIFFVALLQRPYLVYPFITNGAVFTALATAKILFIVFAIGIVILIPSLILLYRLFVFTPA